MAPGTTGTRAPRVDGPPPVRGLVAAGLSVGLAAAVVGTAVLASAASLLGVGSAVPGASAAATARIPPAMLTLYEAAAATCPGLPWSILAAIGTVESDNGQSNLPGVHSGTNAAGAEGPMQFEPATFAAYDEPVPPGGAAPPSPYDPTDAVSAAARLLCADGAAGGANLSGAVYAYNHSASYVAEVLALAQTYSAGTTGVTTTVSEDDTGAGAWPCRGPCPRSARLTSGAARPRASASTAPVSCRPPTPWRAWRCRGWPRTSTTARPSSAPGAALAPGDLVFFGGGPASVDHVGLFVGIVGNQDVMVDAPHTGADVRAEAFPATPGASFGSLLFVGATRPA